MKLSITMNRRKKIALMVGFIIVLLLIPPLLNATISYASYLLLVACYIFLYIIAESGLDILFGYCGQISVGHAAYYAIGAYGSALLSNLTPIPSIITAIIASLIAAGVGALIAMAAAKLKFHFLSLATTAFGFIIYNLALHSPGRITGNSVGLYTGKINLFGFQLTSYTSFYYFGLVMAVLFIIVKVRLVKSRTGRAFIAIRDNSHAADGMGINVRGYKMIAFATSSFFVAFAGAMYVHLVGYIAPNQFAAAQSIMFLTILLFGGKGTLLGPIIGVVVIQITNEYLRVFEMYKTFIYGILLLTVVLILPDGLVSINFKAILAFFKRLFRKVARRDNHVKS